MTKKGKSGKADKSGDAAVVVEGEIVSGRDGNAAGKADVGDGSGPPIVPGSLFRQRLPWILVGLLSVFIGGAFAQPWLELGLQKVAPGWFPAQQTPQTEVISKEDVAALGLRIEQLETGLAEMAADLTAQQVAQQTAQQTGAGLTAADSAIVTETISRLERRVSGLEEALAGFDGATAETNGAQATIYETRVADLEARLDQLATVSISRSDPVSSDGLQLALARLMRTVDLGRPYRAEFLELSARTPTLQPAPRLEVMDALATVETFAPVGVATLDQLADEFEGLVSASYAASLVPGEETPWWRRLWAGAQSAVIIRKTGEAEGTTAEAILGRAEARMAKRDLAATITEIESLPANAGAIFADWLPRALARQSTSRALAIIDRVLTVPARMSGDAESKD